MADLPMGYFLPTSHPDLEYYVLPLLSPLTLFLHSFLHSPSHSQKLYSLFIVLLICFLSPALDYKLCEGRAVSLELGQCLGNSSHGVNRPSVNTCGMKG